MADSVQHFSDLTKYLAFLGLEPPEHPLLAVVQLASDSTTALTDCSNDGIAFSSDCYSISLKHILSGEIVYGRTRYDCQSGTMIFTAPDQVISTRGLSVKSTGKTIFFHKDFIRGTQLKDEIKKYHFFSYAINEALHLSPKEEVMMSRLFEQIELEYHNNQDEFSKELILSQLSTLLKYANRYYHRQFLHRKESDSTLYESFIEVFQKTLDVQSEVARVIPSIEYIADKMHVTPRYLSDALKVETGKTAMEHVHLYLIDQAKDLLLQPDMTVASVAYHLGFEYPQYFARLFKKKVGLTPTEYRKQSSSKMIN